MEKEKRCRVEGSLVRLVTHRSLVSQHGRGGERRKGARAR
eukprot:COSAG01_NODE_1058_length_11898_cov_53.877871_9_plen_40_part_00